MTDYTIYTDVKTAINGDTVQARIVKEGRNYTVDILANGLMLVSRRSFYTSKKAAVAAANWRVEHEITETNRTHSELLARIAAKDAMSAQPNAKSTHETFFTETKLTIDSEKINARISWNAAERQWLIEVLANGMALVNETDCVAQKHIAALTADEMVNSYVQRVFLGRRKHVRFSPVATISLKK